MNENKTPIQEPTLLNVWNQLPKYDPTLIKDTLRRFQKMVITGPSQSCKTTLAIQLAIAVAGEKAWLENDCYKGKVLYVNLDSSVAVIFSRFYEIYQALEIEETSLENITILNFKGNPITSDFVGFMEYLTTLVKSNQYNLVIIDSIGYLLEIGNHEKIVHINKLMDNLIFQSGVCLAVVASNANNSLLTTLSDTVVEVYPISEKSVSDYGLSIKATSFKRDIHKLLKFEYPKVAVIGAYNFDSIQHANNLKREQAHNELIKAFEKLSPYGDPIPVMDLANHLRIKRESLYRKIKKAPDFEISTGMVERINND